MVLNMERKNIFGSVFLLIIIVIIFIIIIFSGNETKDIDVNILDIKYENNHYLVNISLKNNQEEIGWISDTYLETIEGNIIDLTGAGIDEKIKSGKTNNLQLFSSDIFEHINDSPLKLIYTVFPSGKIYSTLI